MRTALTKAKLLGADEGMSYAAAGLDDSDWLDVRVPGDVHRALTAAGRIPDLDHGANHAMADWVEGQEWWYRLRLPPQPAVKSDEQLLLVCHGLDTHATVWLNGEVLGTSRNMFRPAVFDVAELGGREVESLLAICFHRPIEPTAVRKAAFCFGWDFAPRRPTIGPWRPIELVRRRGAAVTSVRFSTTDLAVDGSSARVGVRVTGELVGASAATCRIRLSDPAGNEVGTVETSVVDGEAEVALELADPGLWWTHDLGAPSLHTLVTELLVDGDVVRRDERQVGVRTVQLDESPDPDEPGASMFVFVLDGVRLPVKGANWVPCSTALADVPAERYEGLVTAARDAHMNMLRVWGGGIYEHDAFYDACDRLGLLVWQDFMFAGAMPDDSDAALLEDIEAEARHQVRRLSSRPCLALWCGNNEVEVLANLLEAPDPCPARRIFYEVLPRVVAAADPAATYWPTSPEPSNSQLHGDRHNWAVWHGIHESDLASADRSIAWRQDGVAVDPTSAAAAAFVERADPSHYLADRGRFVSEYGLASALSMETLAAHTDPDHLLLHDEHVMHRLRRAKLGPANKLDLLVGASTGQPRDLLDYVELSQLAQAEGVKIGAEHFRRRWPHCGGSLIWQLDDCWPAISWSLIDVDLRPKAAYFYARRFFAPVLASFAPTADGAELWVSNDTPAPVQADLTVRLRRFDGDTMWTQQVSVDVPAQTSLAVGAWQVASDAATYLHVSSDHPDIAPNRHFFAPVRDLVREVVPPSYVAAVERDTLTVQLTAASYALAVHVALPGTDLRFDDDYVDLEPGEPRTVTAQAPTGLDLSRLVVRSR